MDNNFLDNVVFSNFGNLSNSINLLQSALMLPSSRDQVVTVEWYSDVSLEGVGTLEYSRIKVLFANIG